MISRQSFKGQSFRRPVEILIEPILLDRASPSVSGSSPSNEGIRNISRDTNPQKVCYREIGYFPSLDNETIALIEAVLEDPETAKKMSASNQLERFE